MLRFPHCTLPILPKVRFFSFFLDIDLSSTILKYSLASLISAGIHLCSLLPWFIVLFHVDPYYVIWQEKFPIYANINILLMINVVVALDGKRFWNTDSIIRQPLENWHYRWLYSNLAVFHGVSANAHTRHDQVLKSNTSWITVWASKKNTPYNFITSILAHLPPRWTHYLAVSHIRTTSVIG